MRQSLPALCCLVSGLLLTACQQGSPLTPASITGAAGSAALESGLTAHPHLALFDCDIDPVGLTATIRPRVDRNGQGPQAKSYDLDIENFLRPGDLKVRSVRRDGPETLVLTLTHSHPFPAPDFSAVISGSNRADLGYTGRLLILADLAPGDVPANTWFGNVSLNPALVSNAQGYVQPGDLLAKGMFNVSAFPYVLLVDEVEDTRLGVSNGGQMTGSYNPAISGWQRSNAGTNNTGWTGYDYLHGGQTSSLEVHLDVAALGGGPVSLPMAVLIKYTDPRGLPGRSRRFPTEPADPLAFAYRLPFAALDASVVSVDPIAPVESNGGPLVDVTVQVRDWDATATEAAGVDLSLESDVALVQLGASGAPTIEISAPALFSTPVSIPATGGGSGLPNDELTYAGVISNVLQTAPEGSYWALLRVTDPSASDANAAEYHFGVDPVTLQANSNRAIRPITYQAVPYEVETSLAPPVIISVSPIGTIGAPCQDVMFSAVIDNNPTSWSWDFGGGAAPNTSILESPTVTLAGPGTYNGTLTASNAGGSSAPFPFSYTVAAGPTPTWQTHNVGPVTALSFEYDYASVVSHEGRIAVAYNSGNGGSAATCCDAFFAISNNANPTSQSDWTVSSILAAGFQGQNMSMISYNGQLVASWRDSTAGAVRVAISQVAIPNGEGDWQTYTLEGGFTGLDIELNTVNGLLGMSYGGGSPTTLRFARATTATPTNSGHWLWHTANSTPTVGNDTGWIPFNGVPVVVHRNYNTGDILMARATSAAPSSSADWVHTVIEAAGTGTTAYNGTSLGISETGGRLAVVYNDTVAQVMTFNLATVATPAGPSDWLRYDLDPVGDLAGDLDMKSVNGRLMLFYTFDENPSPGPNNGGLKSARAMNCNPSSPADWQFSTIITGAGSQGYMPGMGVHEGKLVCTSRAPSFQQITIGSGLW